MTHCQLNNLFLFYVHTNVTDVLDLSSIAKHFISINSQRIGKFKFFILYIVTLH